MNSSNILIRSFALIAHRTTSEARIVVIVLNPSGRCQRKSASRDTKRIETRGTFCGRLIKKMNMKQNKASGDI
ncbi:MAG: hypothetical protein P8M50_06960 [Paracoccaceae bacterium]|nr:hypothetical protein [Paracoccaceae bacterium]